MYNVIAKKCRRSFGNITARGFLPRSRRKFRIGCFFAKSWRRPAYNCAGNLSARSVQNVSFLGTVFIKYFSCALLIFFVNVHVKVFYRKCPGRSSKIHDARKPNEPTRTDTHKVHTGREPRESESDPTRTNAATKEKKTF